MDSAVVPTGSLSFAASSVLGAVLSLAGYLRSWRIALRAPSSAVRGGELGLVGGGGWLATRFAGDAGVQPSMLHAAQLRLPGVVRLKGILRPRIVALPR